jgi:hypothetical protein
MTLSELRTLIRKRLGDAGGAFWTDAELNTYINDGCRDVSFRTKSIKANGYITPVSCTSSTASEGVREWALSTAFTNIYSVEDVYYFTNEVWEKLTPTSRDDLNNESDGWLGNVGYTINATTGTATYNYGGSPSVPTHYYWDREEDVIGIDPPPDEDNVGTSYMRVYYTKMHTDISSDGASPTIPEPLHIAVVNFAVATGFEDRGWGDRANDQWEKFFKRINDYKIETNREREDEEIIMKPYRNV